MSDVVGRTFPEDPTPASTDVRTAALPEPRIDVLIPVFNAAATIESALQSICDQTVRDIRMIVVDDGSTDETPRILEAMAARDPRIEVITTPNGGIVDALNRALAAGRAPFVAGHDADDLAFPDRFERQLAYLDAHADCVAVGCNAFHIDVDGRRTGYVTQFRPTVTGNPFNSPSIEPYLLHPFLFARRAALVACGGYRYAFHSEDTDLYWRLAHRGRLANLVETLGEYRIHAQSVSSVSVVNGRISAMNSQLAAISEQRRLRQGVDLAFRKDDLDRFKGACDLDGMLAIASTSLTPVEKTYLETATATKLLELSSYRPYRMTAADLATIRCILGTHYGTLSRTNRVYVLFKLILGRKRLRRDWIEALRLVPWRVMPWAVVDLVQLAPRLWSMARR